MEAVKKVVKDPKTWPAVAVGIAVAMAEMGLLPTEQTTTINSLENRVIVLESDIATAETRATVLDGAISEVKYEVDKNSEALQQVQTSQARIGQKLDDLSEGMRKDLERLFRKMDSVESSLHRRGGTLPGGDPF